MVLAEIFFGLAAIFGYVINGIQAGASVLNTFFQMLPDRMKNIVLGGIMIGGGVFWLEITKSLDFKLLFFGMDLTAAPMAVAILLAFFAVSAEILAWYNFWGSR